MSMITDALRRASNASRASSEDLPVPPPPSPMPSSSAGAFPTPPPLVGMDDSLPPGLGEGEFGTRSTKIQIALALLLVVAVGVAAGINYWEKKNQQKPVDVSANTGRKSILPNANAIRSAATTLAAVTNRSAAAEKAFPGAIATTSAPVVPSSPVVAVAAPAPPVQPPKFPVMRLQSIFYRPSNPSVMINGHTLFAGDEIQGVTVADIQPASVTLVLSGYTNVLTLR